MKLGERQSLRKIYTRWTVVLIILAGISAIAVFRYNREVAAISPDALLRVRPDGRVRVLGRVVSGTLLKDDSMTSFSLSGEPISEATTEISVVYIGKPDDNLRELKMVVLTGFFDPGKMEFTAQNISPTPNIGFVAAAYLITWLSLALFLFNMERSVILLSVLIKEEKRYQPENVATSADSFPPQEGEG